MWIISLLKRIDRKHIDITFDPHLYDRQEYWNLDLDLIEETIRSGRIFGSKCQKPRKLCFKKFFGKKNTTCYVITIVHNKFIEAITAWPRKGN